MPTVVSVSLGSSKRDHKVSLKLAGRQFEVSRVGTDGDVARAVQMIRELDGKVDAIGLGGIDLYLWAGNRRYTIQGARQLAAAARTTPVVDGSGLKNTLERQVIERVAAMGAVEFLGRTALLVCGSDRFGMAQALEAAGTKLVLGDLMWGLGLPIPLHSLKALDRVARVVAPVACRLPFKWLYPTGESQDRNPQPKYVKYYQQADIVAGDLHFIRRYMPPRLDNKTVITNTVTRDNVRELRERGVRTLVTTTPELEGRSFGTNVMEGVLVCLADKPVTELDEQDYRDLLLEIGFEPRIERLEG